MAFRKVLAQRKFAQGAFVPHNHNDRVDATPVKEAPPEKKADKDIIYNQMTPTRLLDYVSFGTLQVRDVRVMVERLQEPVVNKTEPTRKIVSKPLKMLKVKKRARTILTRCRLKKQLKRGGRAQSVVSKTTEYQARRLKRTIIREVVPVPLKKKRLEIKPKPSTPKPSLSGFSSDDDTPLNLIHQNKHSKYFLRKKSESRPVKSKKLLNSEADLPQTNKESQSTKTFYNTNQIDLWIGKSAKILNEKSSKVENQDETPFKVPEIPVAKRIRESSVVIVQAQVHAEAPPALPSPQPHAPPAKAGPPAPVAPAAPSPAPAAPAAPSPAPAALAAPSPAPPSTPSTPSPPSLPATPPDSVRAPSPCPSLSFSTTETFKLASQKDIDKGCKKCLNCNKLIKFFLKQHPGSPINFTREIGMLSSVLEDVDAPTGDVYNFDETDSVKERPTLSRFREQKKKNAKKHAGNKNAVYFDLISNNRSQSIRLKIPSGPQPIMKVSLLKNTENTSEEANPKDDNAAGASKAVTNHTESLSQSSSPAEKPNKQKLLKKKKNKSTEQQNEAESNIRKIVTASKVLEAPIMLPTETEANPNDYNAAGPSKAVTNHTETPSQSSSPAEKPNKQKLLKKKKFKSNEPQNEAESNVPKIVTASKVLEAPIMYPTEKEFENPLAYIQKITPGVSKFGMCKIVPPKQLKPECYFEENARFEVTNQYPGRMFTRWGPATRELCAIKTHLATEKIEFTRPPLIDSMEVNMPKLYHIVQELGGLSNVLEKKKWNKVAEEMGWEPKPSLAKKIDQIYVKYLVPYDTLNNNERQQILLRVEREWRKRYSKMLFRARNPLHKQRQQLGESESSSEEDDDEELSALSEADDCVVRGRAMNLATFKRIATNAMQMHFSGLGRAPTLQEVLDKYWQLVLLGSEHVCVNSAAIDTGEQGYGFPKGKGDPYSKHPWNLKVLSSSPGSVLRSLGPLLGVTLPTLHLGMVFSTSCWHRDPHGLPWIEYMHEGPPKMWYGISEEQSDRLRQAVESLCPAFCQNKSIWLASDITMIPPNLLAEHNVTLSKVVQNPGEFIVIFPKAFSSSICSGFTISESVYYAPLSWLTTVQNDFQEVRDSCEPTMFALEQLLLALAADARAPQSALAPAARALADLVRGELAHRAQLKHLGCRAEFSRFPLRKKNTTPNIRDTSECEICRATLYLSKVVGVYSKTSTHCVMHASQLLGGAGAGAGGAAGRRVQCARPEDLSVTYYYTEEALLDAVERMQQRLMPKDSHSPAQAVPAPHNDN